MSAPAYLKPVQPNGRTFGRLEYNQANNHYHITAEPMVLELAKRIFPGSAANAMGGVVRFAATRRLVGELNWLMLRYPLDVRCPAVYKRDLREAVKHATLRDTGANLTPAIPPGSFTGTLRPYQADGVAHMLHNKRCLVADDTGMGKTVMALAALAKTEAWPALVTCPAGPVQRQWEARAGEFLSFKWGANLLSDLVHIVQGGKDYEWPDVPIYVIHYGLMHYWRTRILEKQFRAIVPDECQNLRITGSQKYGIVSEAARHAEYIWSMSATPIYNYGDEIWSVMNLVDYNCLGDRASFLREWCDSGGDQRIVLKPAVLHDHLKREGLMIRRTKREVGLQMPPKERSIVPVDHDDHVYADLIREAASLARVYVKETVWERKGQLSRKIDEITRYATGMAKLPETVSFIDMLLSAGERPLIFAHHHDVEAGLAEGLRKHGIARITGLETPAQKSRAIADFLEGRVNGLIMALRTTAGVDGLERRGTCVVFAELDWSPSVHTQCEDRVWRNDVVDRLESLLCYYLVSETLYDETMRDRLGLKSQQIAGVMGIPAGEDTTGEGGTRHLQQLIARLAEGGR